MFLSFYYKNFEVAFIELDVFLAKRRRQKRMFGDLYLARGSQFAEPLAR